ncbi:MAG: ribokinase [Devosia sp.]
MIIVVGSINLDLIGRVSRLPKPGETVAGTTFSTAPGGKGANQALAARRAGAQVRMVGAAGKDYMGQQAIALLEASGVDLSLLKRLDQSQGVAMIMVDDAGENFIGILPGTNAAVTLMDADAALRNAQKNDVLIVQQEISQAVTDHVLAMAKQRGLTTILNIAPFLNTTPTVATRAQYLVANETEFALLAGKGELAETMQAWARKHNQTVIVTLGAEGARAAGPDGSQVNVPAFKVVPIDTVGAGDTFVGYLAAGLEGGRYDLAGAMRRAAIAASLACLKRGAQPSIPLVDDVDMALRRGSI